MEGEKGRKKKERKGREGKGREGEEGREKERLAIPILASGAAEYNKSHRAHFSGRLWRCYNKAVCPAQSVCLSVRQGALW